MEKKKIQVVIKRLGEEAVIEEISKGLETLREIVGGRIEMTSHPDFPKGVNLVCNEEGKLEGLKPNIHWGTSDVINGNFLIMAHNASGNSISLTDKQVEFAKNFIAENEIDLSTGSENYEDDFDEDYGCTVLGGSFEDFMRELSGVKSSDVEDDMEM